VTDPTFLNFGMLSHPEWSKALLALGLAVGSILVFTGILQRRRLGLLLAQGEKPLLPNLRSDALLCVALVMLGVALLGPPLGSRKISVLAGGADVVFVIDVSRSMDARDVPPSRLARALRGAEEVLGRLQPSDRVALAVFAGKGALLTPLTPDRDVIANLLASLDTDWMEPASSNAAVGIRAALPAFEAGSQRPRAIFVLSDGEFRRGFKSAAAAATQADVRIFAAGIGTELGANVPGDGGVLRNAEGEVVVSRRDTERLGALTQSGGGRLYRADEWGVFDYASAAIELRRDAGSAPGDKVERVVPVSAARLLSALALMILLVEGLPIPKRWRPRRQIAAALGAAGMLVLLGAAPSEPDESFESLLARANAAPENARLQVELGIAHFARGQIDKAKTAFFASSVATSDPILAAIATYDLGVVDLQSGHLEAARDYFFDALAMAPEAPVSRRARYNLEWALRALSMKPIDEEDEGAESPNASKIQIPDPDRDEEGEDEQQEASSKRLLLSAEERERWLERIEDHNARAMRSALSAAGEPLAGKTREPAW